MQIGLKRRLSYHVIITLAHGNSLTNWNRKLIYAILLQASKNKTLAVGAEEGGMGMPYELLYGRAGFLWAALFVNKHVGEDTIPSNITVDFATSFIITLFSPIP